MRLGPFGRRGPDLGLKQRYPAPAVPWDEVYGTTHIGLVSEAIDTPELHERFGDGLPLPRDYGVALDERCVEYPWVFSQAPAGDVLDAGSALNHAHLIDRLQRRRASLTIVTLEPETVSFPEKRVSYVFADLRRLPFRDEWFDTVVCVSTLEHVGMDNRLYGVDEPRAGDPATELERALAELHRVLKPRGRLLATVPYGRSEDHGWFRQFGRDEVEWLAARTGDATSTTVYAYGREGWQVSDLRRAARASYRDYHVDPSPAADAAVAARAVACLTATRPG